MKGVQVVLFDLWMTLVYGLPTDPILTLQGILKHRKPGEPLDPEFLSKCLTTNINNPDLFLKDIARPFGLAVNRAAKRSFGKLIESERKAATAYDDAVDTLAALSAKGYRLGIISNLWPFPVQRIFTEMGLGAHFEHLIYSYEVGARKPTGKIFEDAACRFQVKARQCVMVGDSLSSDVDGALAAGMQAIHLDRSGKVESLDSPRVQVARSLAEVNNLLP